MRDVLADLMDVWRSGATAGVGTVVRTFRSAPRPPGAAMVVAPDGSVAGSVSGGCVEAAVYEVANDVMASGQSELHSYGVTDDDAFAVGLTCGGTIDVFTEPVSRNTDPPIFNTTLLTRALQAGRATAARSPIATRRPRVRIHHASIGNSRGSGRADKHPGCRCSSPQSWE